MSKHTPGPWKYSTSNAGWSFDIYQADDAGYTPESSDIATLHARTVECDPKAVQEANARLIAAAPDLIEALWIVTEHNALHYGDSHNTVIAGRTALAKAIGKTP